MTSSAPSILGRAVAALRRFDVADAVLVLAVLVRIDVALRFDIDLGYDATTHYAYADLLATGRIPRLWDSGLGSAAYAVHHPPLFYWIAHALGELGLGHRAGSWIALVSGAVRLFLANRLFARHMGMSTRARLFANIVMGFIPFAVRIDVYYSNEGPAATLALAAISLALAKRPVATGLTLGAGFLTKASATAAVPGVVIANLFDDGPRLKIDRPRFTRLVVPGVLSAVLLLPWAWGNLAHYGTPYPTVYQPEVVGEVKTNPGFQEPILLRHPLAWWLPIYRPQHLASPYYGGEENLVRVLHFEAWGDYYTSLRKKGPAPEQVNGKPLTAAMKQTHVASVIVGLFFIVALAAGVVDAVRRLVRRDVTRAELAVASLGIAYLAICVLWAAAVPFSHHGAIKATYALGAVAILSYWTGRGLDLVSRPRALARLVDVVAWAPVVLMVWQRAVW